MRRKQKPGTSYRTGLVAQLAEQGAFTPEVAGSMPAELTAGAKA